MGNDHLSPQFMPESMPQFPKIQEVPQAFQLNFWQHSIFETAARHLLHAYLKGIDDELETPIYRAGQKCEPYAIEHQLVAYLRGEAGTGKSTVIHALLHFAKNGTVTDLLKHLPLLALVQLILMVGQCIVYET